MPIAKTKPKKELWEQTIEFSGPPKIGKTELASQFPNPLFILTEAGQGGRELNHWVHKDHKGSEPYIVNYHTDFDWVYRELSKDTQGFQTLVLDTVDIAEKIIIDGIVKENDAMTLHKGKLSFGVGKELFERRMREIINNFARLPMGKLYVSHLKESSITRDGGEPITTWKDTLNDSAKNIVHSAVDMILMLRKEGKQRWIYSEGDLVLEAGSRVQLPSRIPMGANGKEAYENLVKAFYSGNGNAQDTKDILITNCLKGEAYLSEKKIDGWEVDKRKNASRKKHLLFEDIQKASISNLEAYLQHLRIKAKDKK
ncbi:MAG: AAA family ATPase [Candidatus Peribacteraceae bacterium]|nr:AAA family ATPase [Candidatus Peribacteraceae bacterium]